MAEEQPAADPVSLRPPEADRGCGEVLIKAPGTVGGGLTYSSWDSSPQQEQQAPAGIGHAGGA